MNFDRRIQELLEEILESRSAPEQACADDPDLLPEVFQRLKQLGFLENQLDELFPHSSPSVEGAARSGVWTPESKLPQIDGYEVEGVLGHGGMGVVYRARHLKLKRTVALKMLRSGSYAGPQELARFVREAEAVAGLDHRHIVQVYDVGDLDGSPYFTMEFVAGGSLAEELAGSPQPARRAAEVVAALADAVELAHRNGIIHRDLKPANILITGEGTPKIADFGLARLDGEPQFTRSDARIGTPSYMAPEQALGKSSAIGPSVDIYALGAVLYEMLTGRPPFRAETAAETERQVIVEEPVPPARLNSRVPRDLGTICLKCLHKDPQRRYFTAAALADDLRRFGEGRPILARPSGWPERSWRWVRRKPTAAALVAMALALVALALGGGLRLERQRAEQRTEKARQEGREMQAVLAALQQAEVLQKQGRWPEARAALEGVPSLLGTSAPAELRERLDQARADADMVVRLEEIGFLMLEGRQIHEAVPTGDRLYAEAFRDYGISVTNLEPVKAASRIRNSAIRETLVAFLHDWLFHWAWGEDRGRLRETVDRADDDRWRRRLRESLLSNDTGDLKVLLSDPQAPTQPPVVLAGLAGSLVNTSLAEEARGLLYEARQRHPEDFWINFQLGYLFFYQELPQEAVASFRAAVAIRPNSSRAHTMLSLALHDVGDKIGATAAVRNAIALNPNRAGARGLARMQAPLGGLEEARAVWEKILEGDPPDYDTWYGYAQLSAFLGNEEAYRRACLALHERFGDTGNHWTIFERNSLACLLLPSSPDQLRRAVALVDRAETAGPKFPHPDNCFIQLIRGLAEYRQGRPERAVPLLQESAALLPNRASPRLALAMAQFKCGSAKQAMKNLAVAVRDYNWQRAQADHTTAWVSHVLRREAEALILTNLQAFLEGEYQPPDNDERLALLGICQFKGLNRAAAQLYADAFAADPNLADDLSMECRYRRAREEQPVDDRMEPLNTECRYLAARCAALAGSGLGNDGARLSETERARWRRQARDWLQADLAIWGKTLDSGLPADRDIAKTMLTNWQFEPDLAGLREPNALDEFAADERKECFALWDDVRVVLKRIAQSGPVTTIEPKHTSLMRDGRMDEARVAWQAVLEANPLEHIAWYGYPELCLFLGREDEYRRARQALLLRFGATIDPYVAERTSRACLLMPATGEVLHLATALAERAAAADRSVHTWAYPYFLFAQGLADFRQGRFEKTIAVMRGEVSKVMGPMPRLVVAMALYQSGKVSEARLTLASAVLAYDWRPNQARDHYGWAADQMCHLFRREAEVMILPNVPAFLQGTYQPQDNDERIALVGICQFQGRGCAAARLFADAFATDPALEEALVSTCRAGASLGDRQLVGRTEELATECRYPAARCAALAGCGLGMDGTDIGEAERSRWRKQARDWLRADLLMWETTLQEGSPAARELIRTLLTYWQSESDLAGLREPGALERFSAEERQECVSLWRDVTALLGRSKATK